MQAGAGRTGGLTDVMRSQLERLQGRPSSVGLLLSLQINFARHIFSYRPPNCSKLKLPAIFVFSGGGNFWG
jgi:hypothetical protein